MPAAASISDIDIPGYRVLGALGQGGMASVYLAVQENFGREVALKLVSTRYRGDESFAARFMREAKIVAQMRHSNIVSVYDVGNYEGQLFLSMELLDGDLKSRIGKGINEREAARICIAIASALNYAHEKGYLHRDIKPENVLFRSDGTAVLTDFGIARALQSTESMTQSGMLVGTPSYMSPEQARGETVDQRTDIYALGVLFYELLTGAVPYKATSAVSTALKHISDPIPVLPEPLKHWNPFLRTILAKNSRDRFQSCKDVIAMLALVANITEVDDSERTAIINAAELATLTGRKPRTANAPKDKAISQPTYMGPIGEPRKRGWFLIPSLTVLLIGGIFVLDRLHVFDTPASQAMPHGADSKLPPTPPTNDAAGVIERNRNHDTAGRENVENLQAEAVATQEPADAATTAPVEADKNIDAETDKNAEQPAFEKKDEVAASQTPAVVETAPAVRQEPAVPPPAVAQSAIPQPAISQPAIPQPAISKLKIAPKAVDAEPVAQRRSTPVVTEALPDKPVFVPIESVAPERLQRFKRAFESKDMNALRAVAVISPANQRLAQTLFANYNGISLQLAGVVSAPATNEMRARFVIESLRNSQGQQVEPGDHWKTLPVTARINALGNVLIFW